jgi:hypothetical protein
MSKSKRYSKAWFISDRSGMKFRMSEGIEEPGTGLFIHYSESDGKYNAVDHPQANLHKYAEFGGDPQALEDPSPDQDHAVTDAELEAYPVYDSDGNQIL